MDSKSTATEAQRKRVIEALRLRPQTSYDLRRLGIYQAPARVKELRDKFGYSITTDPVVIVDRDGYHHARVALYTLVNEPGGPQ
ncbi:helix-turn-helix domain-containing protein [Ottowia pentelensis]|uniref:Helix-turn-helix domain-containing protein n=1 Tax=Ottowia pentelensis TaxID=511108 RepID=A0ABV6PVC1_9BURK